MNFIENPHEVPVSDVTRHIRDFPKHHVKNRDPGWECLDCHSCFRGDGTAVVKPGE